jgi:hypothetical protein
VEELKKAVASALKTMPYSLIVDGKMYSGAQLAEHVLNGTPVGAKVVEMVLKGTLERLAKGKQSAS